MYYRAARFFKVLRVRFWEFLLSLKKCFPKWKKKTIFIKLKFTTIYQSSSRQYYYFGQGRFSSNDDIIYDKTAYYPVLQYCTTAAVAKR